MKVYPIKFTPILHDKIWGGQKLKSVLHKKTDLTRVGESWEISTIEGSVSRVANGEYKGESLVNLIKEHRGKLIGKKQYQKFGDTFPLLIKFIDATENLSIQLHPNDTLAKKRHHSFGKTEMWYVVDAEKNTQVNVGFSEAMTPESYQKAVVDKNILPKCNFEKVQAGDTYFIKSGLIHTIGAGCLVAEIQQMSDITYRIYDWDRVDDKRNKRKLHTELAIDALDYSKCSDVKLKFDKKVNQPSEVVSCEYFTTNYIKVEDVLFRDLTSIESFVIYMCVEGSGEIIVNRVSETIQKGETVLIPAKADKIEVKSLEIELLEVYIK